MFRVEQLTPQKHKGGALRDLFFFKKKIGQEKKTRNTFSEE
jgi:hypothetical protein